MIRIPLDEHRVLEADEVRGVAQGGLRATVRLIATGQTIHEDVLNLASAKARRAFLKACVDRVPRVHSVEREQRAPVEEEHLLALLTKCRESLAAKEKAAHAKGGNGVRSPRPVRLTGAQSFVDGVLVYLLLYDDLGVVCVTSEKDIVLQPERSYAFDPPNLPTRASENLLLWIEQGAPPPDGAALVREIVALLGRHLVWPHPAIPWLVSLWVIGTCLFRIFTYFPYLILQSVEKRSGKSLLLEILAEVAWNAVLSATPSAAVLFRDIHVNAPTVLLDEVEHLGNPDQDDHRDLVAVLNAGFKYDATVARCEKRNDGWVPVRYRAYSPKVLAGIKELADVLRDRSLVIRMKRRRQNEKVERFKLRKSAPLLAALRDRLHYFALAHAAEVAALYDAVDDDFPMPSDLDDRARDILEPLYAIAGVIDMAAGDTTCTTKLTEAVVEVMRVRVGDAHDTGVAQAIEALLAHLAATPPGLFGVEADHIVLRAEDAVGVFAGGGLRWVTEPRHARGLLRKLGFSSASHRDRATGKVMRGYRVTRAELVDLAARHIPPEAPEPETQGAPA